MPNRIIRESALTSATLYQLTDGAERFFWRLTLIADDFGRFEADPQILKARCFPLWPDCKMNSRRITTFYGELETAELVTSYMVTGKAYGFFTTWEKHQTRRAKHPKYPPPTPDSICTHMQADVIHMPAYVSEESRNRGVEESRNEESRKGPQAAFSLFWAAYPKKVSKDAAEKAWLTKRCDAVVDEILTALEKNRAWITREGGRFIPNPATWLNAGGWKDEPPPPPALTPKTAGNVEALRRFVERGPA